MPRKPTKRSRSLDDIANEQSAVYLRRSSIHFLECAIHLCVTHMPVEEVAALLEAQAHILREHG